MTGLQRWRPVAARKESGDIVACLAGEVVGEYDLGRALQGVDGAQRKNGCGIVHAVKSHNRRRRDCADQLRDQLGSVLHSPAIQSQGFGGVFGSFPQGFRVTQGKKLTATRWYCFGGGFHPSATSGSIAVSSAGRIRVVRHDA